MNHLHPYWVNSCQIEINELLGCQSVSVDFGEQLGIDNSIAVLNEIEKELVPALSPQRGPNEENKGMTEAEAERRFKEIDEESTVDSL